MSRLIIKNLPNTITSEKLKERFSTQGVVTDIQLKYTSSGKFRHFGFIGFQTPEEAERAVNYFNNTFINQSKIIVEHCAELGDASKPKAWSKYAPDSSAYKKLHPSEDKVKPSSDKDLVVKEKKKDKKDTIDPSIADKLKKHKDDPMFLEFMEAHTKEGGALGSDALKLLTEDKDSGVDEEASEDSEAKESEEVEEKKSSAFAAISDLEYLKLKKKSAKIEKEDEDEKKPEVKPLEEKEDSKHFTVKITNLGFKTKKKDLKDFFRPLKAVGIRIPPKSAGFAYISFKSSKEMRKALNKNKSFLKGKQVGVKEYSGKEDENQKVSETKNEKQKRWKEQEAALMQEESIAESGSIFVRNLAYTISEEELTAHFATFGPLADVTMPVDRESRKMKGFATVTYVMPEHAVAAYTKLDGSVFHGRMLHLLPAKTKASADKEEDEDKNFKDKKKDKQKAAAGQSHNWNTLFLGQNAVVDIIADKYKLSKQEVLTGSAVAVRLALAETQMVSDTRKFLENNGVSLDAFNQAPKVRSKTVILVKNLPAKTTASEIREIFCKFGELGRILLPPSGVTAIVEFLEPSEAKKSFHSLAYTRFKNLPLYLEWAPDDTFTDKGNIKNPDKMEEDNDDKQKEDEKEGENKGENEDEDEIEPEPDTVLYIKNLNFNTTEESIKKHFSKCGRVASVTIARKKDPSRPGELLSMGFGFVQMTRQAEVNRALKQLQHSTLDDHQLELKRSNRTLQESADANRKKSNVEKQTGTKILVRNIPFQATQKEVQQLFETFGEIKALRLPRKMVGTGPHRGFAFVEFHTKHDAKRAMQALCQSTHLFGRRLVLEWAQQEETVEQLRKRTADNFRPEKSQRSKKSKADLEIENNEDDE
ncbi:LOW QUALITY PROTEIN: probable RNA-binding protein 19 [Homalodisca vitripennis]|uniref:LOW QUALITY PROTEIN: probable RNA-binding protein 19 n=1 Tax=Homalodisca vitripennis TaxID=197043 RepID=UPI001EEA8801|nr:LOW QUALITY PROTEIN: probable RNA-binding protein 19 [Homalodisca vitripennis]